MKNLIPILTYILELPKEILIQTRLYKIELYANFLNQDLLEHYEVNGVMAHWLNRFVPCDLDGNILQQPIVMFATFPDPQYEKSIDLYNAAVSRVLFEGFEISIISNYLEIIKNRITDCQVLANQKGTEWYTCINFEKIEDLVSCKVELTPTAQKLIGVSPN